MSQVWFSLYSNILSNVLGGKMVTVGDFAQFAKEHGLEPTELLDLLLSGSKQLGRVCSECSAHVVEGR